MAKIPIKYRSIRGETPQSQEKPKMLGTVAGTPIKRLSSFNQRESATKPSKNPKYWGTVAGTPIKRLSIVQSEEKRHKAK